MLQTTTTTTIAPQHIFFWRRIGGGTGCDVCRVYQRADGGWDMRGMAVFHDEGLACDLGYAVRVDARWVTQAAHVFGHCGERLVDLHFHPGAGGGWGRAVNSIRTPVFQRAHARTWTSISAPPPPPHGFAGGAGADCLVVVPGPAVAGAAASLSAAGCDSVSIWRIYDGV